MRSPLFLILFLYAVAGYAQPTTDEEVIKKIYTTALTGNEGYHYLKELTEIGGRLAGSPEADQAVMRFQQIADSLGFETTLQPVMVPHWVRGEQEKAHYTVEGEMKPVNVCALGGSIATPGNGISGKLVELHSFAQLDSIGDELEGKIAFFNIPMDPAYINTFFAYSNAVKQRWAGAMEASKKGAVAVVTRSLSSTINDYPHTGSMTYTGATRKIPAVAISTADAEKLSRDLSINPDLDFFFRTDCEMKDSVLSANLIADLPGKESPEEIILVGGHIDSWDIGTGAHDDGAGCIHAFEAALLLQKLDLLPGRTLRVVFFMNEEFGLDGAKKYAAEAHKNGLNHVIAMESDAGGFTPRGISMVAPDSIIEKIKSLRDLLEPYGLHEFSQTGAGADISQLAAKDIVMIGLRPDSHRYFEVHHSALDTLDAVNPRELEMGSATLAALVYLLDKYNIVAK